MFLDEKTEEQVFEENEKLIDHTIRKYFGAEVGILEKKDMWQEGAIALVRAIRTFNENQSKFSTYAVYCIRMAIRRYVELNRFDLHVPPKKQHEAFRKGEDALDELLKKATTVSLDNLPSKVDGKRGKDRETGEYRISLPIETIQKQLGIEDDAITSVQASEITKLLTLLSDREKYIFLEFIRNGASIKKTAKSIGISQTRVAVVRNKFRDIVKTACIFEKDRNEDGRGIDYDWWVDEQETQTDPVLEL